MNPERIVSLRNKWFTYSVGLTAGVAVVSIVVGFIWLPSAHPDAGAFGVWYTICRAAGVIRVPPIHEQVVQPTYITTPVEITPRMLRHASTESIGHGATLALRCAMCHSVRRLSQADTPNLAGQSGAVIYKELVDFKTGARASAIMQPLVANLSDAEMQDLAGYYAYLPRPRLDRSSADGAPRIVVDGAPMRGIAPCGACHGGPGAKAGAPWLEGQPEVYLRAQLGGFASGARHNDIDEQMRNVAREMTQQEIDSVSRYFANHR